MDNRPLASLTAGLLARKGAARPAMRRPHIGASPVPTLPVSVQDDLGWNDMGDDGADYSAAPVPPLSVIGVDGTVRAASLFVPTAAEAPAPAQQQAMLEASFAPERPTPDLAPALVLSPVMQASVAALRPRQTRAAFTLRLDPARHLRLRLACILSGQSAQQVVTEALDTFLASHPQVEELVQQLPDTGPSGKETSDR